MSAQLWRAPELRLRLDRIAEDLHLLKAICLEMEVIAEMRAGAESSDLYEDLRKRRIREMILSRNNGDIDAAEISVKNAARRLHGAVYDLLFPIQGVLHGSAPWEELVAACSLREKRNKLKRNRKRRQRKRQQDAELRKNAYERFQQVDQVAEEWRTREIAKDIAKQKMEKMNQLAQKKAKEERQQLEKELELVLLVEKLQELRAIRVQKLKTQGRFFPEEDDQFMERVRAAVEEEEQQAAAAADTSAATLAITNAEVSGILSTKDSTSGDIEEQNSVKDLPESSKRKASEAFNGAEHEGLPPEFYRYYYGSSFDMGTLIEVRRSWDAYLAPGGSRIPGHWVQPSPPSSDVWASCLKSTSKDTV